MTSQDEDCFHTGVAVFHASLGATTEIISGQTNPAEDINKHTTPVIMQDYHKLVHHSQGRGSQSYLGLIAVISWSYLSHI